MSPIDQDSVMPIAVVGVGGRFPGDASDPERLWETLWNGQSTLSETPKDRFNVEAFYHPHAERAGTQNFRGGHFMNRSIDAFDAPFFSITPNEAKAIDPQQRMCLEVAYEALENAGLTLDQVSGTNTSCYVGSFIYDYQKLLDRDPHDFPFYNATGTAASAVSNRLSWFYNLVGPSVTLDTACSSSLVALHLGCQSLRTRESEMALVGGANLICSPETNLMMSNLHLLSPDSKSQTFDEKANGYGRGEGCSFLVLKPLAKALGDGDVIRAVIRNTGSNQDGKTPGLTLPSRTSQRNLILRTYKDAGLDLADTTYFEAHGTGTAAGDWAETQVLGQTFGRAKPSGQPLWMGSVKANIGHLEGASGLAGVVKAIHILEKGRIPPQIWFDRLNPRIKLQEWNLAVPTEPMNCPPTGPRRVSINSFGFAGANAHAILEDAASYLQTHGLEGFHNTKTNSEPKGATTPSVKLPSPLNEAEVSSHDKEAGLSVNSPKLLAWSSHDQAGLTRIFESWKEYLRRKSSDLDAAGKSVLLEDLAYTSATGRTRFPWKTFVVCSTPEDILDANDNMARPIRSSHQPKLAFIFTGQGAQHHRMGRELMIYEIYAQSLDAADAHLKSLGCKWSVHEELSQDESMSRLGDGEYSQPLCTVLQVALVDLLHSLSVSPVAVAGHSSGEIAAAYAKGAITREMAWTIAYHRGQLSGKLSLIRPGIDGAMLAANLSEQEASVYLGQASSGDIAVACVNSPSSVTLSGDRSAILEVEALLKKNGIMARLLNVRTAYHSPHMKLVGTLYRELLDGIKPLLSGYDATKMFSSVTGKEVQNSDLGPDYWVSNLLSQVKFSAAVQALASHSNRRASAKPPKYCYVNAMVEIGPHGALQGPIKQILATAEAECDTMAVLDKKKDAKASFLEVAGMLFQRNYAVDLAAINLDVPTSGQRKRLVDIPPLPWNHSLRYWHESAYSASFRFKKHPRKDLLGVRDNENNDYQPRWRHYLRLSENPWIKDHTVQGRIVYPAAGLLAMALEAAAEMADPGKTVEGYELRDVTIRNALTVPRTENPAETMLQFHPWAPGTLTSGSPPWQAFDIYSRVKDSPWSHNCSGLLRVQYRSEARGNGSIFSDENAIISEQHRINYKRATRACTENVSPPVFYDKLAGTGLELGEPFKNITDIHRSKDQILGTVRIPDIATRMPANFTHKHIIHPCTLDCFVHISLAIMGEGMLGNGLALPVQVARVFVSHEIPSDPGSTFHSYATVKAHGLKDAQMDLHALSENQEKLLVSLEKLTVTKVGGETDRSTDELSGGDERMVASRMDWREDVSYLNGDELKKVCAHSVVNEGRDPLATYLQLLAHKNPGLSVMELNAGRGQITELLLNALRPVDGEQTPWFKLYTATESDEEAIEMLAAMFKAWGAHFKAIPFLMGEDLEQRGLQLHSYDCIIMRYQHATKADADKAVANARALLKDNGTLIVLNTEHSFNGEAGWANILQKHHFSGGIIVTEDSTERTMGTSFMVSRASSELQRVFPHDVLIVVPARRNRCVHQLLGSLTERLKAQSVTPTYATLHEAQDIDLKGKCCIVLSELESPVLFDIGPAMFLTLKRVLLESQNLIWVTCGNLHEADLKSSLITGLARCIRQEHPEVSLKTLDFETTDSADAEFIMQVLDGWRREDADQEFAVRSGRLTVPRLRLDRAANELLSRARDGPKKILAPFKQPDRALTIAVASPGMFDSVYFKDDPTLHEPLAADDIEIEVKVSGLNFMDVMVVLGQVPEPTIGVECSGVVQRIGNQVTSYQPGDRVLTWKLGSFSNFVRSPECMVHAMPTDMTFETAASIPLNYCTAYQALVETANLQRGESILIHGAAGGVGQAAIMMAKKMGAEVFVTVGSEKKKSHIMENYAIPEDHIFNSRDQSFAAGIDRMTGGRGVDVVLNSLTGEGLRQSWLRVAPFGRFIELGKRDIVENTGLDMSPFIKNVSFHAVNVLGTYRESLSRAAQTLKGALRFYYNHHCQPASPIHVMTYSQIPDALRLLRSGKEMGKVVIKATDDDMVLTVPPPIPSARFSPNATYVIVGGLGGVGRYIAQWMVECGARHLLSLSRRGSTHPEASTLLKSLAAQGAQGHIYTCDITDDFQVQQAFSRCQQELPPIRGVIQAAMLLSDATFAQMTHDQWMSSINTKVRGTWNIHRRAPKVLDFFVMLSSVSGIIGWRGQSNYAAGNTFLDALAYYRRSQGLRGVSIDVGAVLDVGYMADKPELKHSAKLQGLVGIAGRELISILQAAITGNIPDSDSDGIQFITGIATGGWAMAHGIEPPYYHADPKMTHLRLIGMAEEGGDQTLGLQETLSKALDLDAATTIVSDALRARLSQQLAVDVEDIDASKPVSGYGVDSLTAVEIRAWSFRDVQADISILDVVNTSSIWALAKTIVRNSRLTPRTIIET